LASMPTIASKVSAIGLVAVRRQICYVHFMFQAIAGRKRANRTLEAQKRFWRNEPILQMRTISEGWGGHRNSAHVVAVAAQGKATQRSIEVA